MARRTRPVSGTRAAQRERSRQRLLEVAARRIAERGPGGTSVQDVAHRAGMTTGAVYHQFRGKEDLIRATIAFALTHPSIYQDAADSAATLAEFLIDAALTEVRLVEDFDSQVSSLIGVQLQTLLAAPYDQEARAAITSFISAQVDELAHHITAVAAAEGRHLELEAEDLAGEYFALVRGFILFSLAGHRLADHARVSAAIERMVASASTGDGTGA
jgi:AcrR family transcriptional regulator